MPPAARPNQKPDPAELAETIRGRLGERAIVLVGMMGAGKSSIGRRLADRLGLPFADADTAIEEAAGKTISEIFAEHGEAYFRDGERRVIGRLLETGGKVLATGGGAFMNEATRELIAERGVAIWLKASLPVLMERVKRRSNRPLLKTEDPEGVLKRLIDERYPVYAVADLTIESRDVPHEVILDEIVFGLDEVLGRSLGRQRMRVRMAVSQSAVVAVALAGRSYDILIGRGLIGGLGNVITDRFPNTRVAIVTDTTVGGIHLEALKAGLGGVQCLGVSTVGAGEASKNAGELARVADDLLGMGVERNDLVIALGGGVVGDLTGFVSAVLRRGVRFVQVPTTLLAQVDSSVGGKTGINSKYGKNLIGAFHQPVLVAADTDALRTLPKRQLAAGYAEVAKYGLLGDLAFFEWLEQSQDAVLGLEDAALRHAIEVSCRAKAAIVARDETETGDRALLNLGHTFGHALEAWAGYSDRLLHGEAIAIGMVLAFQFSERRGLCKAGTAERVASHLARAGLPTRIADAPGAPRPTVPQLIELMGQDKKVQRGHPTLILVRGIGEAFISRDQSWAEIGDFLNDHCG
ncbi:MAG: 3-dehydroquinate synthase [Hyphomicrobiaceae bacterium]